MADRFGFLLDAGVPTLSHSARILHANLLHVEKTLKRHAKFASLLEPRVGCSMPSRHFL